MSEMQLRSRLTAAAEALDRVNALATQGGAKLAGQAQANILRAAAYADGFRHAIALLDHRSACWAALKDVRDNSDPTKNTYKLNGTTLTFEQARFLMSQAYLSTTWATADIITQGAGKLLCVEGTAKNDSRTTNAWSHFLKDGKSAPWLIRDVLRDCFAWPVAVSYIIRNQFMHEGGVADGQSFFDGAMVSDGFRISDHAWTRVMNKAGPSDYRVTDAMTRASIDPGSTQQLDVVLQDCHRELDDALGILAHTSATMAEAYATLLTQ